MGDAYTVVLYIVNQKMLPGSRWVNVPSFIHTKSWSLTSTGVSSFSATDGLGTVQQMEYFCCTDPVFAPSFFWSKHKETAELRAQVCWDIPADRKGWPVISAGAALSLQMPLQSSIRKTKSRCNSLIFLSCLPTSLFQHPDSVGMKIWLGDMCKILLPHMVLVLCQMHRDIINTVCARGSEGDDIRITSSVKGDRLAFHRRYLPM